MWKRGAKGWFGRSLRIPEWQLSTCGPYIFTVVVDDMRQQQRVQFERLEKQRADGVSILAGFRVLARRSYARPNLILAVVSF